MIRLLDYKILIMHTVIDELIHLCMTIIFFNRFEGKEIKNSHFFLAKCVPKETVTKKNSNFSSFFKNNLEHIFKGRFSSF